MPTADTAIDWSGSVSREWTLRELNPQTWQPGDAIDGLQAATVSRDSTGRMLESGTLTVESPIGDGKKEHYVRLELLARQGGAVERWPVATMLAFPTTSNVRRGGWDAASYDLLSALRPAQDVKMKAGYTIRAGSDGAEQAALLLRECLPAAQPIDVQGSFTLSGNTVFARGTTYLDAVWDLLDGAGWCLQLEGDGGVIICQKPSEAAWALDMSTASAMGVTVGAGGASPDVPNRYIAIEGALSATAEYADADSIIARGGRPVEVLDESPQRVNGESLAEYAARRLAELTDVRGTRTMQLAWRPGLTVLDLIQADLPDAGLQGKCRISKQTIAVGAPMVDTEVEALWE